MLEVQGWGHNSLRGLLKSNKGDDPDKIINHLYHGAGYDSDLTRQFAAGMIQTARRLHDIATQPGPDGRSGWLVVVFDGKFIGKERGPARDARNKKNDVVPTGCMWREAMRQLRELGIVWKIAGNGLGGWCSEHCSLGH